MNEIELIAAPVAHLGESYRKAAAERANAVAVGRHRVANRNYDLIVSIARELRSRGRDGECALEQMLEHESLEVRVWAAFHCLPFAATAAEQVLKEAAEGPPSPTRLEAEMTLSEWKAGRLHP